MSSLLLGALGLGGIGGIAALVYFIGPTAFFAFLRGIPWQIWAALAAVLLVVGLVVRGNHYQARAEKAEALNAADCAAARAAVAKPKLDCRYTTKQIQLLGEGYWSFKAALDHQNAGIAAWQSKWAEEQKAATEARRRAAGLAGEAEAARDRLRAVTRSRAAQRAPGPVCEPDDELKDQWQ